MTIMSFKLTSGEEIIATREASLTGVFKISKPRALGLRQTGPNSVGVGMMPWMLSAGDSIIELNGDSIIASVTEALIPKPLIDSYLKEVTGIELPTAETSSILGINK